MSDRTKRLARLAVLAAFGVALLLAASVLPSAKLSLIALAGVLVAAARMEYGFGWGLALYFVTGALALGLLPSKAVGLGYLLFFGYYPLLKSLFERFHRQVLGWVCKLAVYTLAFTGLWWFARLLLTGALVQLAWYWLFLVGIAAFVVYDFCLTWLIMFYIKYISGYLK